MKRQTSDKQYQEMLDHIKKLEETNENLKKEKKQSSKLAIIGEKMSQMNHNLRNPLSIIFGNAQLIYMQAKDTKNEKNITRSENIMSAVTIMLNQINDLTSFIKGETIEFELKSLNQILNNSINLIKKPQTISIQLPERDIICKCDPSKLQIVFMNLFTNAMDAMENSGKIVVRTTETNERITIEIEDSGPEIPHEIFSKIFETLFTTKKNGTGLGLPYCKNVIEQHGGTIHANTCPTIFTITLPR